MPRSRSASAGDQPLKTPAFHILLALADRDLHGVGVMKAVQQQTDGAVQLWPVTLYGTLKQLLADGFVEAADPRDDALRDGDRRRFYHITARGRRALTQEVRRLSSYVELARQRHVVRSTRADQ